MKKNLLSVFSSSYVLFALAGSLFLLLNACKQKDVSQETTRQEATQEPALTEEQMLNKGKEIAGQINTTLQQALKKAIEEKGFEGAISFCSIEAIPITDSISQKENVRIRRVSHKARNQQNLATAADMKIIERYWQMSQDTLAKKQPMVSMDQNSNTFYAPIYVANPLCLSCHGAVNKEIMPSVNQAILAKYPNDLANGFKLNDFRGLLKIEF